jgi:predicted RNA binding protein YcfA (HicA-like mRNA interferase family)
MSKSSKEPSREESKEPSREVIKKPRICSYPKDYTWNELLKLLAEHGYEPRKNGRTGGSRRRFIHDTKQTIILHEPHPSNILKEYQLKLVIEILGIC